MNTCVCLLLSWIQCTYTINESHKVHKYIKRSHYLIRYLIPVSRIQAKGHPMILNPLLVILKYLRNCVWELEPTTEVLHNRYDYA